MKRKKEHDLSFLSLPVNNSNNGTGSSECEPGLLQEIKPHFVYLCCVTLLFVDGLAFAAIFNEESFTVFHNLLYSLHIPIYPYFMYLSNLGVPEELLSTVVFIPLFLVGFLLFEYTFSDKNIPPLSTKTRDIKGHE